MSHIFWVVYYCSLPVTDNSCCRSNVLCIWCTWTHERLKSVDKNEFISQGRDWRWLRNVY